MVLINANLRLSAGDCKMIDTFTTQVNELVLFFSRFGRFYPIRYVYYTELIYKRLSRKKKKKRWLTQKYCMTLKAQKLAETEDFCLCQKTHGATHSAT